MTGPLRQADGRRGGPVRSAPPRRPSARRSSPQPPRPSVRGRRGRRRVARGAGQRPPRPPRWRRGPTCTCAGPRQAARRAPRTRSARRCRRAGCPPGSAPVHIGNTGQSQPRPAPAGSAEHASMLGTVTDKAGPVGIECKMVVEIDGPCYHQNEQVQQDKNRDNMNLALDDVKTHRFGLVAVTERACETAAMVAATLRRSGWPGSPRPCRRSDCAVSRVAPRARQHSGSLATAQCGQ